MEIIINACFGGWSISDTAYEDLHTLIPEMKDTHCDELRNHPLLIEYLKKHGSEVTSGRLAELHLINIPDDVKWYIEDYDGIETIHEVHRVWEYVEDED